MNTYVFAYVYGCMYMFRNSEFRQKNPVSPDTAKESCISRLDAYAYAKAACACGNPHVLVTLTSFAVTIRKRFLNIRNE